MKVVFFLLIIMSLVLPVTAYAESSTPDNYDINCNIEARLLDETDIRNDPVFVVFLEKYPDARYYHGMVEYLAPWDEFSFVYPDFYDIEAQLVYNTRGCDGYYSYTLGLPSGDYKFFPDTAFPNGDLPYGVNLKSVDEITDSVGDLLQKDTYIPAKDKLKDKIKKLMHSKSKLPENKQNSFDYWCLNDHFISLTDIKLPGGPSKEDKTKLEKLAEEIVQKYSADENYALYSEHIGTSPLIYYINRDSIVFSMDIINPLKMSKAQEILVNYNNTKIYTDHLAIYELDSCIDTLEDMLDINIAESTKYNHVYFMNLRGDIVVVEPSSVRELFDRGYLTLRMW